MAEIVPILAEALAYMPHAIAVPGGAYETSNRPLRTTPINAARLSPLFVNSTTQKSRFSI